jgi:hypothetical protein
MSRTARLLAGFGAIVGLCVTSIAMGQLDAPSSQWRAGMVRDLPPLENPTPYVAKAIEILEESSNAEDRIFALRLLSAASQTSEQARDYLIGQRLNYTDAKERNLALGDMGALGDILTEDMPRLLPIVRDGLNDPNKDVRENALRVLGLALKSYWYAARWPETNRAEPVSEDMIDEVYELIIWKGLTDENYSNARKALEMLRRESDFFKPTIRQVRSLNRVTENFEIMDWNHTFRRSIETLCTQWEIEVLGAELPPPSAPEDNTGDLPAGFFW